jgi:hypothetical protein
MRGECGGRLYKYLVDYLVLIGKMVVEDLLLSFQEAVLNCAVLGWMEKTGISVEQNREL